MHKYFVARTLSAAYTMAVISVPPQADLFLGHTIDLEARNHQLMHQGRATPGSADSVNPVHDNPPQISQSSPDHACGRGLDRASH